MAKVEIYTMDWCGYCHRAKTLLKKKGVEFTEIAVDMEPGARERMVERAGGQRTVPQIFIDGKHVGGSDELYDLEQAGKLDAMLGLGG